RTHRSGSGRDQRRRRAFACVAGRSRPSGISRRWERAMTLSVAPMEPGEVGRIRILPEAGFGALETDRGNLPLDRLAVRTSIAGLSARTVVAAEFVNVHDVPLGATYIFPLPDRAAGTGMTRTAEGHPVSAELQERGAARETYDRAIAEGKRASIAEEERPDV